MKTVKKAVIPAAGRGTRQYPATNSVKKELFPLVDRDGLPKPVIQIVVEEALESGIEEICIVTAPGDQKRIQRHFRGIPPDLKADLRNKEWMIQISDRLGEMRKRLSFVVQETQEGFGHAIFCARDFVGGEPFLVMLGDHIYLSRSSHRCARQLISVFEQFRGNVSAVQRTPESLLHLFGTVAGDPMSSNPPVYSVRSIYEKPDPAFARRHLKTEGLAEREYLCFFGMHILMPGIFEVLEEHIARNLRENGEIQLTSAQARLAEQEPYFAMEPYGHRLDMGVPAGYIETQIALAFHSPYRNIVEETLIRLTSLHRLPS